jgi:hypothetical protein
MVAGDEAKAAGYAVLSGTDLVKNGDDEINLTRDYIARVKNTVPTSKGGFRTASGISSGLADPVNSSGADGDIYFKIL